MIRKKLLGLVVIALFLLSVAGAASAATLDLPKWVIVPEDAINFADVTLFCGFDSYDATNNVTPCYMQGSLVNATIYFNSTVEYPKLVQGAILNAFEFDGNLPEKVSISAFLNATSSIDLVVFVTVKSTTTGDLVTYWEGTNKKGFILNENGIGQLVLIVGHGDGTYSAYVFLTPQLNTQYFIVLHIATDSIHIEVYNAETKELVSTADYTPSKQIVFPALTDTITFTLGAGKWSLRPFVGVLDEVRFRVDKQFTQDEIQLLLYAGRKKLSEPAQFRQIFSPMIDLTRDHATFYAGLEVSTSDPSGYVPVPESAVNMSITSAPKLTSDYTGYPFYYQGHYWYKAQNIQFSLPIQFETVREKNSFAKEILLDEDSKTFIYEKEFKVTNPTATRINVVYSVDPASLGFSVLQYPQFELDGVPMAEWRPSNSTNLYLIRTDSLEPGEISTHWMKSIWTITKEELEFPAKIDDFRSITTFEQARKLAENAIEGKTDTYVKVIKIDSNADVSNVTILVPLKDVEDESDVIEAVALTGSRETLQVEKLEDGKVVVKVPGDAFVSGHAEIKVLYNKEGKSGIFAFISKILARIKAILRKLGLGGLVFGPYMVNAHFGG